MQKQLFKEAISSEIFRVISIASKQIEIES
jgi:poly(A) polymerase